MTRKRLWLKGLQDRTEALRRSLELFTGIQDIRADAQVFAARGKITHPEVAAALNASYSPAEEALAA
jgi:hypothetical protein